MKISTKEIYMRGLSSESLIARVGYYVNKWIDYRTKISPILIDQFLQTADIPYFWCVTYPLSP